ncbi:hypothetical protein MTR67_030178 [Solanum verrucosum]|uniref:Uncharacterized protein n=1 Tax=Solanum verrucosum TaxID=315347 RepID=A0AAF0R8U8_SOLVR|nr:hypothetical protein MTR67_030178 [Solanum verrucosum]
MDKFLLVRCALWSLSLNAKVKTQFWEPLLLAGVTFCKSIVYSFLKGILDGIVGVAGCDLWRLWCCKYEKWCGVDIAAV